MATSDLHVVIGVVLLGLSVPAALGALADRRPPRVAAVVIVAGFGLLLYGMVRGGLGPSGILEAFVRVAAYYGR